MHIGALGRAIEALLGQERNAVVRRRRVGNFFKSGWG